MTVYVVVYHPYLNGGSHIVGLYEAKEDAEAERDRGLRRYVMPMSVHPAGATQ